MRPACLPASPLLAAAALALSACATTPYTGPVEVTRFVADQPAGLGQGTIAVVFPDEMGNLAARAAFASAVSEQLARLGYTVVPEGTPAGQTATIRTTRNAIAAAHQMNVGVLRYFNVAGADPQARSGQSTAGATHLIKVAIEAALGLRESVSVFGTDYDTPDGTGVRDYIHVSDLAAAHVLTLEALMAEPARSLTMNCGYGRGFSVSEVLDAVDRVTNRPLVRRIEGRRAGDPDSLIADSRVLRETLGWEPAHADLDTIIAHALAWERKLGDLRAAG